VTAYSAFHPSLEKLVSLFELTEPGHPEIMLETFLAERD
jgi:hypothetical protein